jgi:hypothetical protein
MWEMGLMKYLERKHIPNVEKCFVDTKPSRKVTQLKMRDLSSALVLYGSGVAIAMFVFLAERVLAVKLTLAK